MGWRHLAGWRAALLALLACMHGAALAQSQASSAADDDGMVTLWRVIPADFANPDFDPVTLEELLQTSLPRRVDVAPSDTLSGIIQRTFNVSQSWTPAVYDEVLEHVKRVNGLTDANRLKPGRLRVPDLPQTAKSDPAPNKAMNAFPKISNIVDSGWDASLRALVGKHTVSEAGRTGARQVLQIRRVPLAEAKALTEEAGMVTTPYAYKASDAPMLVELSAVPSPGAAGTGCPAVDPALGALIGQKPRGRAVVVVLDDAWPDQAEFLKARDFVDQASRAIRARFKMEGATPTQDLDDLRSRTATSFPPGIAQYPAIGTHAGAIKASLREFTCNDPAGGVEVIYLPMTYAQSGALPLLREIMFLSYLARSTSNRFTPEIQWTEPPSDQIKAAQQLAAEPFRPKGKMTALLSPFQGDQPGTLKTDQALVEQVAFFLRLYSDATDVPHFLSMSWIARELSLQVYFPEYSYGLMLAAAGNAAAVDVHEKRVQFAYRSTNPGDVIAVENSDGTQWLCSSSRFTRAADIDVLGVGYPGRIDGTALCGTSFSTPRVAWLLAAREAWVAPAPKAEDRSTWQARQKTRIRRLTSAAAADSARFYVTWQKLVGLP